MGFEADARAVTTSEACESTPARGPTALLASGVGARCENCVARSQPLWPAGVSLPVSQPAFTSIMTLCSSPSSQAWW